jgi:hypothetical protein
MVEVVLATVAARVAVTFFTVAALIFDYLPVGLLHICTAWSGIRAYLQLRDWWHVVRLAVIPSSAPSCVPLLRAEINTKLFVRSTQLIEAFIAAPRVTPVVDPCCTLTPLSNSNTCHFIVTAPVLPVRMNDNVVVLVISDLPIWKVL